MNRANFDRPIYRDSYEIRAAILSACDLEVGTKFTKVMYKSYVAYIQVRDLVYKCEKLGLLEVKNGLLFLTPKGKEVIDITRELKEMIKN